MCYLFPIWHPDMGMYVRIALLTVLCYSWWEENQTEDLFATGPELKSMLVLQFWASYSSRCAGIFIIVLLLSSVCSIKWTLVMSQPLHACSTHSFFSPSPPVEKHHKLQWLQGLPLLRAGQKEFILPICNLLLLCETQMLMCTQKREQTHLSLSKTPAEIYQLSHIEITFLVF